MCFSSFSLGMRTHNTLSFVRTFYVTKLMAEFYSYNRTENQAENITDENDFGNARAIGSPVFEPASSYNSRRVL